MRPPSSRSKLDAHVLSLVRAARLTYTICAESLYRFWAIGAIRKWELNGRPCLYPDGCRDG